MSLLQRKQSRGPGAPLAVPRPSRRTCRSSLGPGGAMSCWPGPCCLPSARKRSTGAPGKSAQRKDHQVSCVYSSQPSWVAVGILGKAQLVTGFGALESGAGGNKHFAPLLPLLEKLRFPCVTSQECIGGSYCSVLRSQFSRLPWPLFEPQGASCCRLSLWELACTSSQPGFS